MGVIRMDDLGSADMIVGGVTITLKDALELHSTTYARASGPERTPRPAWQALCFESVAKQSVAEFSLGAPPVLKDVPRPGRCHRLPSKTS
jgi:hypothetical protein